MVTESSIRYILALKLREIRRRSKISLDELSQKTGISKSYITEIEAGLKYPKEGKIFILAKALKVPYDELVSLKIEPSLFPIARMINSGLLNRLPWDLFGIDNHTLFKLFISEPIKSGSIINTISDIILTEEISLDYFFGTAIRSYVELNGNYFPEIEESAIIFKKSILEKKGQNTEELEKILLKNFKLKVIEIELDSLKNLQKNIRSIDLRDEGINIIVLNKNITNQQKKFDLLRYIGIEFLKLNPYSKFYPKIAEVESFNEWINNYKASYFACCILIPTTNLVQDLIKNFNLKKWEPNKFIQMVKKYDVSMETFMHRTSSILPKFFDLKKLFFVKINYYEENNRFEIEKKSQLSNDISSFKINPKMNLCRRWLALNIFEKNNMLNHKFSDKIVVDTQITENIRTKEKFFYITIANKHNNKYSSITIGFEHDSNLENIVSFSNDPKIEKEIVNENCETCPINDCKVRVANFKTPRVVEVSNELNFA